MAVHMAMSLTYTWLCLGLTLAVQQNAPECDVNARQEDLLADREAVVPEGVGRRVHEEQASVSELQLHRFNLSAALLSSRVSVFEEEVPRCSQRDRRDGTAGVQLLLVVTVLAHVILPIFVPDGEKCVDQ